MCAEFKTICTKMKEGIEEQKRKHGEEIIRIRRDHQRQLDILQKNDRGQETIIRNLRNQYEIEIEKITQELNVMKEVKKAN